MFLNHKSNKPIITIIERRFSELANTKIRQKRNLTDDEVRRLTSLSPNDITKDFMIESFANFEGSDAKYLPSDRFVLRKEIVNNFAEDKSYQKEDIHTTVGRYIVNLFLIFWNPKIIKKVGYLNKVMNSGAIGDLSNEIVSLMLNDVITVEETYEYFNRLEWFGFTNSSFTTPSVNYDLLKPQPKVLKRKEELLKQNEEAMNKGDVKVSSEIESELIDIAKEELKDNPARALYDSGAKVNWGNQYKNMNIMCGPLINNSDGNYRMVTKSFIEGLDKEDIAANGDSCVTGVYSRAVGDISLYTRLNINISRG
jgi:stress response protein YsnF